MILTNRVTKDGLHIRYDLVGYRNKMPIYTPQIWSIITHTKRQEHKKDKKNSSLDQKLN